MRSFNEILIEIDIFSSKKNQWRHMASLIWMTTGSSNDLRCDGNKSLQIWFECWLFLNHYNDVIMGAIGSQITSPTIVYSVVYSDGDQRKHQSSASLAFVQGIHWRPVNSPHKGPVTRKTFHLMTSSCNVIGNTAQCISAFSQESWYLKITVLIC